jgi:hypothetical protein
MLFIEMVSLQVVLCLEKMGPTIVVLRVVFYARCFGEMLFLKAVCSIVYYYIITSV